MLSARPVPGPLLLCRLQRVAGSPGWAVVRATEPASRCRNGHRDVCSIRRRRRVVVRDQALASRRRSRRSPRCVGSTSERRTRLARREALELRDADLDRRSSRPARGAPRRCAKQATCSSCVVRFMIVLKTEVDEPERRRRPACVAKSPIVTPIRRRPGFARRPRGHGLGQCRCPRTRDAALRPAAARSGPVPMPSSRARPSPGQVGVRVRSVVDAADGRASAERCVAAVMVVAV